jgi:HAD superfamily hydrolase (TIGR01549 family)
MLNLNNRQKVCFPEAVIFDTDNTLYPYEPAHKMAIESVIKKAIYIFGIRESEFIQAFENSRSEVKERLGNTASSHSRLLYFQRTIENLGMGTRILTALDFEQTYWRTFLANAKIFPGVIEFLQQLKIRGIRTANITDLTAQIQFRKMVYFGLDEYFDYVVTSEEAGCDKPDVRPFEIALHKLKIPAQKIWMIGDDQESDMVGAGRMGMVKIKWGNDRINVTDNVPDVTFTSYKELMLLLDNSDIS